MDLEKLLAKNPRQLRLGRIVSGAGLALYIAGSALEVPDAVLLGPLIVFALIAVWTLLSILNRPREERAEEGSVSLVWGQLAVTVLLGACALLTIRQLLGG